MIKTFNDNLDQIEVEFVNSKEEKKIRKARYLTIKDLRKLDEIRNDFKNSTNPEDPEQDIFSVLCKQMSFIFGGEKEEYEEYSFPMLKSVMDYIKEVFLLNPMENHVQK